VSTLIRQSIRRQQGMALISALLLLLVVTIMAISMFRSYGMQEKMAGNTREKQRALNAAVSAQQYAEWFLSSGTPPPKTVCTALVPSTTGQVCNTPMVDFTVLPWNVGVTYLPFTTNSSGVVSNVSNTPTGTGATLSYYQAPTFYITDLGPGYGGEVYQIDALGYGGLANTVAVVESTYVVGNGTAICPDIHCP
jgi:type IV pilus assembly protein PilX